MSFVSFLDFFCITPQGALACNEIMTFFQHKHVENEDNLPFLKSSSVD